MEQKKNKKIWIGIGVLVVLLVCAGAIAAVFLLGGEKEGETPSLLGEEVQREVTAGSGITIVTGGFKMALPNDYDCFYAEGIGPVIYMDDVFQMRLKVVDGTYEEAAANPDKIMSGTTEAGGNILQEVEEQKVGDKKYLYYIMELAGQKCYVVYTQAADSEMRIAGQIAVESEKVTDEDILGMFADITAKAVATDEPDTDEETLMAMKSDAARGDVKTESTLSIGDCTVTFLVPGGFYGQGQYALSDTISEYFLTKDYAVEVDCCLQLPDEDGYQTAEQYVALCFEWLDEDVKKDFKVEKKEVEGQIYWFYHVNYEEDGETHKEALYATDVAGGLYSVTVNVAEEEAELTEETIKEFLLLK